MRTRPARRAAVTLELWSDTENDAERSCCSASAVAPGAQEPLPLDGTPTFHPSIYEPSSGAGVVDPFIAGFAAGETPNPCVGCNGHVRLDALLDVADRLGCEVSGHRALRPTGSIFRRPPVRCCARLPIRPRTRRTCWLRCRPTRWPACVFRSAASCSSQRSETSAPARPACRSRASRTRQDLRFLAGTDRSRFLARHGGIADRRGGDRRAPYGAELALHGGQHRFTVGQRRGLGIAGDAPLYVLDKDAASNRVTVGRTRPWAPTGLGSAESGCIGPARGSTG